MREYLEQCDLAVTLYEDGRMYYKKDRFDNDTKNVEVPTQKIATFLSGTRKFVLVDHKERVLLSNFAPYIKGREAEDHIQIIRNALIEMRSQIHIWQQERDNLENKIEEGFLRIDKLLDQLEKMEA